MDSDGGAITILTKARISFHSQCRLQVAVVYTEEEEAEER